MIFDLVCNVKNPKKGYVYAVLQGTYKGELLVFIHQEKSEFCFLTIPGLYIIKVPTESFLSGINSKIIEFVKKIPGKYFKILEFQYTKLNITYGLRSTKTDTEPNKRTSNTPENS
jgi:hypothetical protein